MVIMVHEKPVLSYWFTEVALMVQEKRVLSYWFTKGGLMVQEKCVLKGLLWFRRSRC